jgi:hypothetical protein
MNGKVVYSPGEFCKNDEYNKKNWRYSQMLTDQYWKRFVLEYLPEISRRTKWHDNVKPIEIGDLVLIVDESAPRNVWERGIVESLHPGRDSKVRTATIRTSTTTRKRAVSKLAILDVKKKECKSVIH